MMERGCLEQERRWKNSFAPKISLLQGYRTFGKRGGSVILMIIKERVEQRGHHGRGVE